MEYNGDFFEDDDSLLDCQDKDFYEDDDSLLDCQDKDFYEDDEDTISAVFNNHIKPPLKQSAYDTGQNNNNVLDSSLPIKLSSNISLRNPSQQNNNNNDSIKLPNKKKNILKSQSLTISKKQISQQHHIQYNPEQFCDFRLAPSFYAFSPCFILYTNPRPYTVRSDDRNCTLMNANSSRCQFASKGRMKLSPDVQKFKDGYYKIFTTKKKFPKKYVKLINDNFLIKKLHLQRMSRLETRNINLYFQNHFEQKDEILNILEENKNEIKEMFLKDIIPN